MLNTDIRLIEQRKQHYRNLQYRTPKSQGPKNPYESKGYIELPNSCAVDLNNMKPVISDKIYRSLSNYVSIGEIHEIPKSVTHGLKYQVSNWWLRNMSKIYKVEDNKGINCHDPRVRNIDICLAKYSQKVAETMDVSSACYTGVKHALWASGVIDDYLDMPKGSAHLAPNYLNAHPEKFEKLNVSLQELKKLPAGHIIVYEKEGYDGHIAITNGYGQEMSDCTDNMMWVERRKEGATYSVYKLTDGWKYNPDTKKLEFKQNS